MLRLLPSSVSIGHLFLAILGVLVCTVGLVAVRHYLTEPVIALLYLLPVILSTAYAGLSPGIAASLTAFLAFNYFFIEPYHSFSVHHTQDLLALVVFLIVAGVTSQLVGRAREGQAAANAREREAIWLHEISMALAGIHDGQAIAQALAEQCRHLFRPQHLTISLEMTPSTVPLTVKLPENVPLPENKPSLIIPLQTARGLMGEVCLWRRDPISPAEERLLRTFASQGVLALERARFSQAETRARVLEESDRLKTALLNSVSHELRTPLATIKASVSSLRSDEIDWDSNARQDLLATIEEETDHLNELVSNLLNMSRIEAGVLRLQRRWNVLAEIVGGVLARMKRTSLHHDIRDEIPADLPLVPVDYSLMEQVFSNLIGNSQKYAPEGTTIHIQARRRDEHTLLVRVTNQGPHVPEEDLVRIFDKFYHAAHDNGDASSVDPGAAVTGAGLGLSICKGIVEAHGGYIWAENLTGGFAFNFTLPLTVEGMPRPHDVLDTDSNE